MDAIYGDSSLPLAIVKNLFDEFQRDLKSVFDEPHPWTLKTATSEDNVTKVHYIVLTDCRLNLQ